MRQLTVAIALCAGSLPLRAADFQIQHFGTPVEAQPAIARAAEIWGGILHSDVTIKVAVSWFPLGASALGITFPNGRKDFAGAPMTATWYASCLANSIAGTELNPGEDDINVYLNASTNWYLGLDGNTPAGQYDLVSIALHELGHGLGFVGLAKKVGSEGSFGLLQISDFAPLLTTFPWPQQDTLPGIFDRHLTSTAQGQLHLLANPSTLLGTAFTSNQLYFNGPYAVAVNNGQQPRIYAPGAFALGSSCVHLNEVSYPVGNPNELMTPFGSLGHANHWPGPIAIAIMRDIGWELMPGVGVEEHARTARCGLWPNPVEEVLHVSCSTRGRVLITDVSGRTFSRLAHDATIDVSALASGSYIIHWEGAAPQRFTKQ